VCSPWRCCSTGSVDHEREAALGLPPDSARS
jgi:hypothetical protein